MKENNISNRDAAGRRLTPIEFPDALAWAAWLYFIDELTQSEVAERLGVSRVTVMKMLNDAKVRGIVNIRINPSIASQATSSRHLAQVFGLNSVMIIPNDESGTLTQRLGRAGAFAIVEDLHEGDVVGVAWGRTVLSVAKAATLGEPIPNLTVVQVAASPNGLSADFSPELCASLLANNLGARSVSLLAPAIVSSPELRSMLLQEPSIRNQLDIIRSANKVVFGVGDLGEGATVRRSELHTEQTIEKLIRQGSVGVVLGTFIDADGKEMPVPTHDRNIGITLDEFKAIPARLCVAGGPHKTAAMLAALRGGLATDLITDSETAALLLEQVTRN